MTRAGTVDGTAPVSVGGEKDRGPGTWRRLVVGTTSALVAGAALGAVARLMMRLTTLAAGGETHFSLAGTAGILLVFALFTLPGAVLASLLRRRGRSALLFIGALTLCVPTIGVAAEDLSGLGTLTPLEVAGVALATCGVFVAILTLPFLTLRLVARGLSGPH